MSRYIDADKLIENQFKNDLSYNAFVNLVKRQPTADVRENTKGRWEVSYPFHCSACKGYSTSKTDFCPNCGADMRGGRE